MSLQEQLKSELKTAMLAKDKARVGTIRLLMAEIKQKEVDTRTVLNDEEIIAVLTKMVKQRKDSISQYEAAGRQDLADIEAAEIVVLQAFLPQPLSEAEIDTLIDSTVTQLAASGMQDMGKVMNALRPQLQGRADMAVVSAKLKARLDAGEDLPQYFKDHPILYAGPAKTPEGYPCGSMGPTTSNRMDPYVDEFQSHGGSMIMIGKGNRTDVVTEACKKHGGFYLGTIGGVAAILSHDCIKSIECVEYPELGMEAIWKITVENFPAFILVDDKGHDFFKELKPWKCSC